MKNFRLLGAAALLPLSGCTISFSPGEEASLGMIGGADGPTAILVAGPDVSTAAAVIALVLAAAAAAGILYLIRRRKRK